MAAVWRDPETGAAEAQDREHANERQARSAARAQPAPAASG